MPSGEILAVNWAVLNVIGRSYADVNGDNVVDILDVVAVLDMLGPCDGACAEDVDGSGSVEMGDIDAILSKWGSRCSM